MLQITSFSDLNPQYPPSNSKVFHFKLVQFNFNLQHLLLANRMPSIYNNNTTNLFLAKNFKYTQVSYLLGLKTSLAMNSSNCFTTRK